MSRLTAQTTNTPCRTAKPPYWKHSGDCSVLTTFRRGF